MPRVGAPDDYRRVLIAGESERVATEVARHADLIVRTRADGTWRVEKDRNRAPFGPLPFDGLPRDVKDAIVRSRAS